MSESSLPQLEFRRAEPVDAPDLSALAFRSKAHWGYSEQFMAACRDELSVSISDISNPRKHVLILESRKCLVGFCHLERISEDSWELDAMFVDPLFIGRGAGRVLFEKVKTIAIEDAAKYITIQSDPNALDFYRAMGCIDSGEKESCSIPGRYLPLLVYRLPEMQ